MKLFNIILLFFSFNLFAHHPGYKIEAIFPYPTLDHFKNCTVRFRTPKDPIRTFDL